MSLLSEYLSILNEQEHDILLSSEWSPREHDLLHVLLHTNEHDAESAELIQSMSTGYRDKLHSVLLRKCYERLVPNGGMDLLQHLWSKKVLVKNLQKEIRYQRRVLVPMLSSAERKDYYEWLLLFATDQLVYDTDETLMKQTMKHYLQYIDVKLQATERMVCQALIASSRISTLASLMKLQARREDPRLESQLLKLYEAAHNHTSLRAKLATAMALYDYYSAIESDKRSAFINEAQGIITEYPDIGIYSRQRIQVKYATNLYQVSSDFVAAQAAFCELFELFPAALTNIYSNAKFIQVCLILGRHKEAYKALRTCFAPLLERETIPEAANAALNFAKYYTMTGDLQKALDYIYRGMKLLQRRLYVQYEIEFRNLECAVHVLRNDEDLALNTIERNLKYLRAKGFSAANSDFHEYYVFLRELTMDGPTIVTKAKNQDILAKWSLGIYNIYGALLKVVLRSVQKKVKR